MQHSTAIAPRKTLSLKPRAPAPQPVVTPEPVQAPQAPAVIDDAACEAMLALPEHELAKIPRVKTLPQKLRAAIKEARVRIKREQKYAKLRPLYDHERVRAVIEDAFPYLFKPHPVPLSHGILEMMRSVSRGMGLPVERWEVRLFLEHHCNSLEYLNALAQGGYRYNIYGKPMRLVIDQHKEHAAQQILAIKKAKREARLAQAQQATAMAMEKAKTPTAA